MKITGHLARTLIALLLTVTILGLGLPSVPGTTLPTAHAGASVDPCASTGNYHFRRQPQARPVTALAIVAPQPVSLRQLGFAIVARAVREYVKPGVSTLTFYAKVASANPDGPGASVVTAQIPAVVPYPLAPTINPFWPVNRKQAIQACYQFLQQQVKDQLSAAQAAADRVSDQLLHERDSGWPQPGNPADAWQFAGTAYRAWSSMVLLTVSNFPSGPRLGATGLSNLSGWHFEAIVACTSSAAQCTMTRHWLRTTAIAAKVSGVTGLWDASQINVLHNLFAAQ